MKKLLLVLLLIPALCFGQDFRHRYFHYDQLFTDADNNWNISAATIDGADNKEIQLCGGGAISATSCSNSRGAYIELRGNEWGGASGDVNIIAGNAATGHILFNTGGAFRLKIPYLADTDDVDLVLGSNSTTTPVFTIKANTSDADDDGVLQITPGGAFGASRGSLIQLVGSDFGGADLGGQLTLSTGAGKDGTNFAALTLKGGTTDGADYNALYLEGGGGLAASRGAFMAMYGNENSAAGGAFNISAGDTNTLGAIIFSTGASFNQWIIPRQTANTVVDLGFGGYGYTSTTVATIKSYRDTDGTDDDTLQLTGGGSSTMNGNRGAYITLEGADVGGTAGYGGDINIVGGVGADTTAGHYPVITIRNDTVDASDWGYVQITGGGQFNTSLSRGAALRLFGNEQGSNPAIAELSAGDAAGGTIRLVTGAGYQQWEVPRQTGLSSIELTFGADAANAVNASIHSRRNTDGSDDDVLELCGGGACSNYTGGTGRGSQIRVSGNESSDGGDVEIQAGNSGSGDIRLSTWSSRYIIFNSGDRGHALNVKPLCEEVTIAVGQGAAGVTTAANICASGTILGASARITDAPGGGAATFDLGCTGSGNLDQFCDGVATGLNTTCAYPTNGDGTNTPWVQKTATTMTITTDANVSGDNMKIRVCSNYLDSTAPIS